MLAGMVPDAYVYRRANRLIEQHGDDALLVATELVERKNERCLMIRIMLAVAALQEPPTELLQWARYASPAVSRVIRPGGFAPTARD
jgi:hypothetical protein